MARFTVPDPPSISVYQIENFKGIDLHNSPPNVAEYRSAEAPNMIRDVPGKIRKRMGYEKVSFFSEKINGFFTLDLPDETIFLLHSGTTLYNVTKPNGEIAGTGSESVSLWEEMADVRSKAWQMGRKLYIQDGKRLLSFDGTTVSPLDTEGYIPTIVISRLPTGGGTTLDPYNLLSEKWIESFILSEEDREKAVTAGSLTLQLTDNDLLPDCKVEVKNTANGEYEQLEQGTFVFSAADGTVVFSSDNIPTATPVLGQDNIRVTVGKARTGWKDRINHCDLSILYGVGGNSDRMFISGNSEYPNYDWYCEKDDPTYWGDTYYSVLGQDNSPIMGYSIIAEKLATHKKNAEDGRNVIVRQGVLDNEGKVGFPISTTLQGEGTVAKWSFGYLSTEPLFLTQLGVYAVTPADVTGERYAQGRSFYLNKAIMEEENMQNAFGMVYKDFYLLAMNQKVYLLDGLQKSYEKGAPYSSYQYEGYLWTNIPAHILWELDGKLYFGTENGYIFRFFTDTEAQISYSDYNFETGENDLPIESYWCMGDLDGTRFYKNKTFRFCSVRLGAAVATGVEVFVKKDGAWQKLFESGASARFFDFSQINFAKWSFSSDTTPRTIGRKIKVKKVDKAMFKFENSTINEPFSIYNIAFEYTTGTNYKR
mgnify:CR=1 FL=1